MVLSELLRVPVLTRTRVRLAWAVAIATDVVQSALGPFGWTGVDETLDVAAAVVTWRLLVFHPLLLPTFAVEFLPLIDMLPTWTGCVGLVIALRKRQQAEQQPPISGTVIDV